MVVHTVEYYSASKGKETPAPTGENPEDILLSEINHKRANAMQFSLFEL